MAEDNLKIFISWSGDLARSIARIWRDLLNEMFDGVTPWVSDVDIEAGTRGLDEIQRELDGTFFGIIVVTKANQNAPWINFEAGALSKSLPDSTTRVVPSLVDLTSPAQITSPIKQFQATLLDEEGVKRVLKAIANADAISVDWQTKERSFARMWPEYKTKFTDAIERSGEHPSSAPAQRQPEDMLEELLTISRDISRQVSGRVSPRGPLTYSSATNLKKSVENFVVEQGINPREVKVGLQRDQVAIIVLIEEPEGVARKLQKMLFKQYGANVTGNITVASYPSGMNGGDGYYLDSQYLID